MSKHEDREARIEAALAKALDAATSNHEDGTLWEAGHNAFYQAPHRYLDEQLAAALNAACINDADGEAYEIGEQTFYEELGDGHHTGSRFMDKLRSIPSYFKRK